MRSNRVLAVTTALALAYSVPAAHAWNITPYDVPGASYTQLWGVNDSGVLVGTDSNGGFIDDHGAITTLNAPWAAAQATVAAGISNSGLVAGGTDTESFFYQNGVYTEFSAPGAAFTFIRSISSNGRYVAGTYGDSESSSALNGFVFDRQTSTFTQIVPPSGLGINVIQGVNDFGQVTGTFSGPHPTSVIFDSTSQTEQLFQNSGNLVNLRFRDINDAGVVTGFAVDASTGHTVGIIGSPSHGFATIDFGATLTTALYGVNSSATEAVGFDFAKADQSDLQGFIATVPEPATLPLVACGLVALGLALRRREDRRSE